MNANATEDDEEKARDENFCFVVCTAARELSTRDQKMHGVLEPPDGHTAW